MEVCCGSPDGEQAGSRNTTTFLLGPKKERPLRAAAKQTHQAGPSSSRRSWMPIKSDELVTLEDVLALGAAKGSKVGET